MELQSGMLGFHKLFVVAWLWWMTFGVYGAEVTSTTPINLVSKQLHLCETMSISDAKCSDTLRLIFDIKNKVLMEGDGSHKPQVFTIRSFHDVSADTEVLFSSPIVVKLLQDSPQQIYPLHFKKTVNAQPVEITYHKDNLSNFTGCSKSSQELLCPHLPHSSPQGFCCTCDGNRLHDPYHRRGGQTCVTETGPVSATDPHHSSLHCFRLHPIWHSIYEMGAPYLEHSLAMVVSTQTHEKGSRQYQTRVISSSSVHLNDNNTNSKLTSFYSTKATPASLINCQHNESLLLIPQPVSLPANYKGTDVIEECLRQNLLADRQLVDLTGASCDKVGVSAKTFISHENRCQLQSSSCLKNQPYSLWLKDKELLAGRRTPQYMIQAEHAILHDDKRGRNVLAFPYEEEDLGRLVMDLPIGGLGLIQQPMVSAAVTEVIIITNTTFTKVNAHILNNGAVTLDTSVSIMGCPGPCTWSRVDNVRLVPYQVVQVEIIRREEEALIEAKYSLCEVAVTINNSSVLARRGIQFKPMDRCVCLAHCRCDCISSGRLNCKPLSPEEYQATGLLVEMPASAAEPWTPSSIVSLIVVLFFSLLLLLGCVKAILGLTVSTFIGEMGLCLFLRVDDDKKRDRWSVPALNIVYCFYAPFTWLHWLIIRKKGDRHDYQVLKDEPSESMSALANIEGRKELPRTPKHPLPQPVPSSPVKTAPKGMLRSEGDVDQTTAASAPVEAGVPGMLRDFRNSKRKILNGSVEPSPERPSPGRTNLRNRLSSRTTRDAAEPNSEQEDLSRPLSRAEKSRLSRLEKAPVIYFNSDGPSALLQNSGSMFSLAGSLLVEDGKYIFSTESHSMQVAVCVGQELVRLEDPLPLPSYISKRTFTGPHQVLHHLSDRPKHHCLNVHPGW